MRKDDFPPHRQPRQARRINRTSHFASAQAGRHAVTCYYATLFYAFADDFDENGKRNISQRTICRALRRPGAPDFSNGASPIFYGVIKRLAFIYNFPTAVLSLANAHSRTQRTKMGFTHTHISAMFCYSTDRSSMISTGFDLDDDKSLSLFTTYHFMITESILGLQARASASMTISRSQHHFCSQSPTLSGRYEISHT